MIASSQPTATIAEKIADRPAPAPEWSPPAIADLLRRIDQALDARQAA